MWQLMMVGFTIGCMSSFHCIGMCGPLSLALPVQHLTVARKHGVIVLYNLGRVFTYSLLGLIFGLAGRSFHLAGLQQWLTITLGILLFVSAAFFLFNRKHLRPKFSLPFYSFIYRAMNKLLQQKHIAGYLALGITNGFLPCGMVYLALAFATSLTEVPESIAVMFAFGTGTLPAMIAVGYAGLHVSSNMRIFIRQASPYLIMLTGVLLILRGMSLDIPFLSPLITAHKGSIISCHE